MRLGRDLRDAQLSLAIVHDATRQIRVGGQRSLHSLPLFSRETESTKFVSEEFATACARRIQMPASPRRRARCTRHEARARIVALVSCCLYRVVSYGSAMEVWALLMRLPSHFQRRSVCRGEPGLQWRQARQQQSSFFAVLNGTSITDPEPVNFSCVPESWANGRNTSETTAKDIISDRISFTARAAIVPLLDWLPGCVAHDCCNLESLDALGGDCSFFAVTQQCLCSQNATLQACLQIATLLTGSPTSFRSFCGCEG